MESSFMDQDRPCGRVAEFPVLATPIEPEQYRQAMEKAEGLGLHRLESKDLGRLLRRLFG